MDHNDPFPIGDDPCESIFGDLCKICWNAKTIGLMHLGCPSCTFLLRGRSEEARAFLRAIAARPSDALPLLVFADWLDDQGLANQAKAQRCAASLFGCRDSENTL